MPQAQGSTFSYDNRRTPQGRFGIVSGRSVESRHARSSVSFLNGALALGALTALVPLVIHLFNRSRFKVIKWGASHLLESVIRKPQANSTGTMDHFNHPLLDSRPACSCSCENGSNELEFLSFFFLLPLAALLFLIMVAFSKRLVFFGDTYMLCLLITLLFGCLGLLPDWGKDKSFPPLREMFQPARLSC